MACSSCGGGSSFTSNPASLTTPQHNPVSAPAEYPAHTNFFPGTNPSGASSAGFAQPSNPNAPPADQAFQRKDV